MLPVCSQPAQSDRHLDPSPLRGTPPTPNVFTMTTELIFPPLVSNVLAPLQFALAEEPLGSIERLWQLSLLASVVLFLGCMLVPKYLVSLQSMPWAFQPRYNLDLDFQAITYETYHGKHWSRGTHYALVPEQVAWFVLLAAWHPWLPVAALAGLSLQAVAMREHPFSAILILSYASIAALGYAVLWLGGGQLIVPGAQAFLLLAAALRVVGHASEPLPPMLLERTDRFTPLRDARLHPLMLLILVAGYVSEFASALPGRLFNVQVYQFALALGYRPRRSSDRATLKNWSERIHRDGWCAYPKTAALFRDLLPDPDSQPSPLPATTPLPRSEQTAPLAHLGVRFDATAKSPGLNAGSIGEWSGS